MKAKRRQMVRWVAFGEDVYVGIRHLGWIDFEHEKNHQWFWCAPGFSEGNAVTKEGARRALLAAVKKGGK